AQQPIGRATTLAIKSADQSEYPKGTVMNRKQKAVLIAVAGTVVGMLIYPPFHATLPGGAVRSVGYGLIVNPPTLDRPYRDLTGTVDVGLLMTQWLGVVIVGGIAFVLFKD